MTLFNLVGVDHIPPVPHVESNNRLRILFVGACFWRRRIGLTEHGTRLGVKFSGDIGAPRVNTRRTLFHEEAEVEDVLDGLREAPGIEQRVHGGYVALLPEVPLDELFRRSLVLLLPNALFEAVNPLLCIIICLPAHLIDRLANDTDVLFDGRQFVPIAFLLVLLLHVVGILQLDFIVVCCLPFPPLSFLPLLGLVLRVERSVQEPRIRGEAAEADAGLKAEVGPVELSPDRALLCEGLRQTDRVVARHLHQLLRLPGRLRG
mmetsp:Transcript_29951/g.67192  ORF Transcript_29951/g.67192 Transcript_29951/m.67192 type:complete len:262 (+) Transcript_29951:212-997(+)